MARIDAEEFYSILADVDPGLARSIVNSLLDTDTAECIAMARSFGELPKPDVSNIIAVLCESFPLEKQLKAELTLRLILDSVFDTGLSIESLEKRAALNMEGIEILALKTESFKSPLLKARIISLIPFMELEKCASLVMREGYTLLAVMKRNKGVLDPELTLETLEVIKAAAALGNKEYLSLCIEFMSVTKDEDIHRKARETMAFLLHAR